MNIYTWTSGRPHAAVEAFLARPVFDRKAEKTAQTILESIRRRGEQAILDCALRFDRVRLTATKLRVTPAECRAAQRAVDPAFLRAARKTFRNVTAFAKAGRKKDWSIATRHGGHTGEKFVPFDRIGVYVPGGAAPLASTALMTATLARAAGVPEIVACTPCGPDGRINPFVLTALTLAGATEIYRVGGIQAIGLMTWGTPRIRPVQKIVGPGNRFVTAAKRQVYGYVALDLVAGPSELAVLADTSASPRWIAADLLSQAEHGTGDEKILLVTPSARIARATQQELEKQSATLSRSAAIRRVLKQGALIAITPDLTQGIELCNRFAPEHLELMVRNPRRVLAQIHCAGAVFLGPWTPESVGDFVAGPSHVLPTGGAAARFAGLTVDDFQRRISYMEYTRKDLGQNLSAIKTFGRVESLDAHARSAAIRFES